MVDSSKGEDANPMSAQLNTYENQFNTDVIAVKMQPTKYQSQTHHTAIAMIVPMCFFGVLLMNFIPQGSGSLGSNGSRFNQRIILTNTNNDVMWCFNGSAIIVLVLLFSFNAYFEKSHNNWKITKKE